MFGDDSISESDNFEIEYVDHKFIGECHANLHQIYKDEFHEVLFLEIFSLDYKKKAN